MRKNRCVWRQGRSAKYGLKSKMGPTLLNILYGLGRTPESTQRLHSKSSRSVVRGPHPPSKLPDPPMEIVKPQKEITLLLDATNEGTR